MGQSSLIKYSGLMGRGQIGTSQVKMMLTGNLTVQPESAQSPCMPIHYVVYGPTFMTTHTNI